MRDTEGQKKEPLEWSSSLNMEKKT